LEALCASVDDVFARPASRENLRAMVRGLLSEVPRKNLWQLAEAAGHPNPDRLQGFLAKAAWDAGALRDRVRAVAVASLAADDAVLIADETGDIKKGTKTAGVQRQYTGTAGACISIGSSKIFVAGDRVNWPVLSAGWRRHPGGVCDTAGRPVTAAGRGTGRSCGGQR
jgi:SRSO17 transposase